jgi:hypothetical protein
MLPFRAASAAGLLLAMAPASASASGTPGHEIVAAVAEDRLTPEARVSCHGAGV